MMMMMMMMERNKKKLKAIMTKTLCRLIFMKLSEQNAIHGGTRLQLDVELVFVIDQAFIV